MTDPDFGRFAQSRDHQRHAHCLIPGGAHTYAKGDDQMPEWMPVVIDRGKGSHVWDIDGNRFIEYGQGLRAVTLGHAEPRVNRAATEWIARGANFTRPARVELEAAEAFLDLVGADCVKFTKDGSSATTAAVKVARAATGRDVVAICEDHPFLSQDDWFIGTTPMDAGIPDAVKRLTVGFPYGDLGALVEVLDTHRPACVVMEAVRDESDPGEYIRACIAACRERGVVFVLDEMITGFRWSERGVQGLFELDPDLSTFGKALANGFSVSALAGRRDLLEAGGLDTDRDRLFLLSATHGAETHALAAAIEAMRIARDEDVAGQLMRQGARLREAVREVTEAAGLGAFVGTAGRDCNLVFSTRDLDGHASQLFRTLFLQELTRRGVLAPSFVITTAHTDDVIDQTAEAVAGALEVYGRALDAGSVDGFLLGRPVQPVFRKKAGTVWTSVSRPSGDGAVSEAPRIRTTPHA
ncbi:glutamate-1-semialdehyde 2,1-aminomutase [Rubrivirga marina]|uniref:Glutamate-1-semialdehyde 2,1-aminomutase n=1 Tax=Rubrivirga marina TaxID=1196024 RepID=A0A271J2F6_9BACT|nr:glutamate-1-semialdehyde 2,1-aminomutase [Rubrivirga marina]PAP77701.1 glutamate-1-semialdehyde 2,1-aminomutase [Rubrivirga marina]